MREFFGFVQLLMGIMMAYAMGLVVPGPMDITVARIAVSFIIIRGMIDVIISE
jgi:hypothetical protein